MTKKNKIKIGFLDQSSSNSTPNANTSNFVVIVPCSKYSRAKL